MTDTRLPPLYRRPQVLHARRAHAGPHPHGPGLRRVPGYRGLPAPHQHLPQLQLLQLQFALAELGVQL